MSIGRQIRHYRIQKGMTLKQLSELIHYAENSIHNWESGKRSPDIETTQKIADALGVAVIQLLKRDGVRNMAHIEGLRFIGSRHLEEMEQNIPQEVLNWFEDFELCNKEAGYPALLNDVYGYMQIDEYWHQGTTDDIADEWKAENPSVSDSGLLHKLQETARLLQTLEPNLLVYVGDKTGPLDSHEFSIFFPIGTSNDVCNQILKSYEYAGSKVDHSLSA